MQIVSSFRPKQKIEEFSLSSDGFSIQARNVGLIGSLMSLLGIGAKSYLEVDPRGAAFRTTSFSGETRAYIPLAAVSATVYRNGKPTALLGIALFFLVTGFPMFLSGESAAGGAVWLFLAAVFAALFAFSASTVTIGVLSSAGSADTLLLEAKGDQVDQLIKATSWLEGAVCEAGRVRSGVVDSRVSEPTGTASHRATSPVRTVLETPRSGGF